MSEKELSAVEAELYDRQIRLWGIESQEKLRAANVLLINIRALGSEVAKNILLSGINSLTILDDGDVTQEEQELNFLLQRDSKGKKIAEEVLVKAQALNPLVKIKADTDSPASKDPGYFKDFTIIIATCIKTDLLLKIDKACRANNVKLIFGDVIGTFAYSVADFLEHKYHEDKVTYARKKRSADGTEKTVTKVLNTLNYPELKKVLVLPNTKQNVASIKNSKRKNELFFVMLVLLEFKNKNGRNPSLDSIEEDTKTLEAIKKEVFELYEIDETKSKLAADVFDSVFGELQPVFAILGGFIAQEVIKVVSGKETPVNNVFLFDPVSFDGKEVTVGA